MAGNVADVTVRWRDSERTEISAEARFRRSGFCRGLPIHSKPQPFFHGYIVYGGDRNARRQRQWLVLGAPRVMRGPGMHILNRVLQLPTIEATTSAKSQRRVDTLLVTLPNFLSLNGSLCASTAFALFMACPTEARVDIGSIFS